MAAKIAFRIVPIAMFGLANAFLTTPSLAQSTVTPGSNVDVEGTSTSVFLTDPFSVSLGTYVVSNDLKATFDGNANKSNEPVDFAHTFGTNGDHQRIRADALWRITEKHHLRFVYFNNNLSNTRTLDKDFAWGNYTFSANASVTAQSKLSVYELSYEYEFVRRPNFELSAGAGVHMLDMSIKLSGQATLTDSNGNVSPASYSSSNSNLPVPLPVIGARAAWAVTPNIIIEPEFQWLKVHYDAYDGDWWDLRVAGKWMFSRHFGVGLGYDYFKVNVGVDKAAFNGNVTLGYSGLQAMIVGSF